MSWQALRRPGSFPHPRGTAPSATAPRISAYRRIGVCLLALAGTLSSSSPAAFAQQPPTRDHRVGLVLSGGSARGFAHIGVIRVLEEAGIEVAVISGASMGSIVGALYAIGYTPDQLATVARTADWDRLFDDSRDRRNLSLERKGEVGRHVLMLPLRGWRPRLPGGFVAGQRIGQFFALLTWSAHPVRDFRQLSIPFAAVATDAETGGSVRLTAGYLPQAMQASMAIPGVFEPVLIDGRPLTDGGVVRNLPAEDALALGADFLICSDVSKPLLPADSLQDLLAVLDQTIGYRGWEETLRQRQLCDVLILPDIENLSSRAFDRADEWAERGEEAAREALPAIDETLSNRRPAISEEARPRNRDPVADSVYVTDYGFVGLRHASAEFIIDKLGLPVPGWVRLRDLDAAIGRLYDTGRFKLVNYRLDTPQHGGLTGWGGQHARQADVAQGQSGRRLLTVQVTEESYRALGLSYRYDSRYKTSVLGSLVITDPLGAGSRFAADLRLGEQGVLAGQLSHRFGNLPEFVFGVEAAFRRSPFDIYEGNLRLSTPRAYSTQLRLSGGLALGNAAVLGAAVTGEHADLGEFAAAGEGFLAGSQTFHALGVFLKIDRFDRPAFPRSGVDVLVKGDWADGSFGSSLTFAHRLLDARGALPLADRRLSVLGRLALGSASGETPVHYLFFLGGSNTYYLFPDRHFQFSGLRTMERSGSAVQLLQVGLQYEVSRYLLGRLRWNAGRVMDDWSVDTDLLSYGFDLTAAVVTRFGNASLSFAVLDVESLPHLDIDIGFPF